MPVTFSIADQSVRDVLNDVIDRWHEDLAEVELRVCLMLATAPRDDKGKALVPALKLHGCKCAAIASLIPYKQRAAGADDVRIDIDADFWATATEAERTSLLDHEANHFEVQRDDEGNVKSDDCGRPKIKIRPHDWEVGFFHAIARRHGDASEEVKQAKAFADQHGQTYFGWGAPPDRSPESAPPADALPKSIAIAHVAAEKIKAALGGALEWGEVEEDRWEAASRAVPGDDDTAHTYVVTYDPDDSKWHVAESSARLLPRAAKDWPTFSDQASARAWCGERDADLADGKPVVTTADGRKITPKQMMGEIGAAFAK